MPKIYSKDLLMMRELWRKAYRQRGLTIKFQTEAQAHRARMLLYNAVKAEKHLQGEDSELVAAAETIEVVFGETKAILLLRRRQDNPLFQAMESALGQSLEGMDDPEAKAMEERLHGRGHAGVDADRLLDFGILPSTGSLDPSEGRPDPLEVLRRGKTKP